ncbi:MAG: hypothetical protein LUD72_09765 [Bacteroidales bacterium]|nr:hypothetical protein [Bacteroidales bacterium]
MAIKVIGVGSFTANVNNSGEYCQSYTQEHSVTEYTCQNAVGDTVGVALCDDTTETRVLQLVVNDVQVPSIGYTDSVLGVVVGTRYLASKDAFQTYEVTYKRWTESLP